ncbi:unnamed protein product [Phytophthora fragariaefolia]|uniref:Unnamed protein product n=1 Tax=Phytophthora fragariaefolia TaxID=1490495 RepID=A0A9W7CSM5_9STRA|nr:unnamed protein product [Phytophthora fragariaefolia]
MLVCHNTLSLKRIAVAREETLEPSLDWLKGYADKNARGTAGASHTRTPNRFRVVSVRAELLTNVLGHQATACQHHQHVPERESQLPVPEVQLLDRQDWQVEQRLAPVRGVCSVHQAWSSSTRASSYYA